MVHHYESKLPATAAMFAIFQFTAIGTSGCEKFTIVIASGVSGERYVLRR